MPSRTPGASGAGFHVGSGAALSSFVPTPFNKVDVNARIASEIVEYISEKAGTIAITVGEDGSEAVKAFLLRAAALADASYTVGSWQSALLRALAQSDAFCAGGFKAMLPIGV